MLTARVGPAGDSAPVYPTCFRHVSHLLLPCISLCMTLLLPVVALGTSHIIALGGVDGEGIALASVEILDVVQNAWTLISPLPEVRAAPSAVVHDGTIFIFGGCNVDGVPLKSGRSLKLNRDSDSEFARCVGSEQVHWVQMPDMLQARAAFGMVLAGSHIVAIGGSSVDSQHLNTTEFINIADIVGSAAKWANGCPMKHERRYCAVAAVLSLESASLATPPETARKAPSKMIGHSMGRWKVHTMPYRDQIDAQLRKWRQCGEKILKHEGGHSMDAPSSSLARRWKKDGDTTLAMRWRSDHDTLKTIDQETQQLYSVEQWHKAAAAVLRAKRDVLESLEVLGNANMMIVAQQALKMSNAKMASVQHAKQIGCTQWIHLFPINHPFEVLIQEQGLSTDQRTLVLGLCDCDELGILGKEEVKTAINKFNKFGDDIQCLIRGAVEFQMDVDTRFDSGRVNTNRKEIVLKGFLRKHRSPASGCFDQDCEKMQKFWRNLDFLNDAKNQAQKRGQELLKEEKWLLKESHCDKKLKERQIGALMLGVAREFIIRNPEAAIEFLLNKVHKKQAGEGVKRDHAKRVSNAIVELVRRAAEYHSDDEPHPEVFMSEQAKIWPKVDEAFKVFTEKFNDDSIPKHDAFLAAFQVLDFAIAGESMAQTKQPASYRHKSLIIMDAMLLCEMMDRIEKAADPAGSSCRKTDGKRTDCLEEFIADKSRPSNLQKFKDQHQLTEKPSVGTKFKNIGTKCWNKSIEVLNGSVSASATGAEGMAWGAEMWEAAYSRSQTSTALLLDVFDSFNKKKDSWWIWFTGMKDVMLQMVSRLFGLKLLSFSPFTLS